MRHEMDLVRIVPPTDDEVSQKRIAEQIRHQDEVAKSTETKILEQIREHKMRVQENVNKLIAYYAEYFPDEARVFNDAIDFHQNSIKQLTELLEKVRGV